MININLLRDSDEGVGFYVAGAPSATGRSRWGATLYRSRDEGASYQSVGVLQNAATIGVSITALANYLGKHTVDEKDGVVVGTRWGTLASVTYANMLNNIQIAIIGEEVVGFRSATLNPNGSYLLRGLIRGMRGTEAAMSTHVIGERFLLVTPETVVRVPGSTDDIGKTWLFKAVTSGNNLDNATAQAFTYSGAGLKPYAPVDLGGGRVPGGDALLRWTRRNRLSGEWRNNVDVPMSESSLAYQVEIFSSSAYATVVRTIDVTTEEVTYTAAQSIADHGSVIPTIYFAVYQMSSIVGRGYQARGAV